jgi:hypothetical protein
MTKISSNDNDFDWLANIYTVHGAINHPSELHGILIGHLAGGCHLNSSEWLSLVLDHMGAESFDDTRQVHVKQDLDEYRDSIDQELESDSSSLVLLLPDDDYALSERAEALAIWVRGFLEGIALTAGTALSKVDKELQEIIRDLVNISQMDTRVSAGEEGERELFEVAEYVKVGVLNLYADFNQPVSHNEKGASQGPTLH